MYLNDMKICKKLFGKLRSSVVTGKVQCTVIDPLWKWKICNTEEYATKDQVGDLDDHVVVRCDKQNAVDTQKNTYNVKRQIQRKKLERVWKHGFHTGPQKERILLHAPSVLVYQNIWRVTLKAAISYWMKAMWSCLQLIWQTEMFMSSVMSLEVWREEKSSTKHKQNQTLSVKKVSYWSTLNKQHQKRKWRDCGS